MFVFLITFYADIYSFKYGDKVHCDIYISIPYYELRYKEFKTIYQSEFQEDIKIYDKNGKLITQGEWKRMCYIPSYSVAEERAMHTLDRFEIELAPGEYKFEISIKNRGREIKRIVKKELHRYEGFTVSDIILATLIRAGQQGKFVKNGLEILANPSNIFLKNSKYLYYYFEIYGLRKDAPYQVIVDILKGDSVLLSYPKMSNYAEDVDILYAGAVEITDLPVGEYLLRVKVRQDKDSVCAEKCFIKGEPKMEITAKIRKYWDFIDYIADEKELKQYKRLGKENKDEFLLKFWLKRGRVALFEHCERVEYADKHFAYGKKLGRYTDMGRIYIKYGRPDEEFVIPATSDYPECVKWVYIGKGYEFIFIDKKGTGFYELAYSNVEEDKPFYDYSRFINPLIWGR